MFVNVLKCAVVAAIFLAATEQATAQSGYPYLVFANNLQGKPISPLGCNSLADAQNQAAYLQTLQFSAVRIVRNTPTNPFPGKTLQQYKTEVQDVYRRAVDATNWARGNVGRLTTQQFNDVNKLINDFNGSLSAAQQSSYGSSFGGYSRLSTIPSSWIGESYGIYYRRGNGSWTFLQTVNGVAAAQQAVANLRRQYQGYEFGYARR